MLKKTFCHIAGISKDIEKNIWEHGITSWDHFVEKAHLLTHFPDITIERIKAELHASWQAFEQKNIHYFKDLLPSKEHWRLASFGKMAFIDIETTGMSRYNDDITMIGIYDGKSSETYIKGQNLDEAHTKLQSFNVFVTYNGKQFDIPFIEGHFGVCYDAVHLDLRYMLREFGLQGGLKSIERQLGICRDTAGIDGFEAVRLWRRYQKGDDAALELLIKYNQEDIVNLQILLDHYLKQKMASF